MGLYFILSILSAVVTPAVTSPPGAHLSDPQQPQIQPKFAGVYFERNAKNLDDESKVALRLFVRNLNNTHKEKNKLIIMGLFNQNESENLAFERAKAVGRYLSTIGIPEENIEIQVAGTNKTINMPVEIYLK